MEVAVLHRRVEADAIADADAGAEELPAYEATVLPTYGSVSTVTAIELQSPHLVTYHLRVSAKSRSRHHFVCLDRRTGLSRSCYEVEYRTGSSLFSKKPDITLSRFDNNAPPRSLSTSNIASPIPIRLPSIIKPPIAGLHFNVSGSLPWVPRAKVSFEPTRTLLMEACGRGLGQWAVELEGRAHVWSLAQNPTSLVLEEGTTGAIKARFVYSEFGTSAGKGAEVGRLLILDGEDVQADSEEVTTWAETLMATVLVPLWHWRCMGKMFSNRPRDKPVGYEGGARRSSTAGIGISLFAGRG